jgi:hypothetical protein
MNLNMNTKIIGLAYFFCWLWCAMPLKAQEKLNNLTGRWLGTITQTGANKIASTYYFELTIQLDSTQNNSFPIKGTTYTYLRNTEGKYLLKANFEGKTTANTLFFKELNVIAYENSIQKKTDYCVKNATLQLQADEKMMLEGEWQGKEHKSDNACGGGIIRVEKLMPDTTNGLGYEGETLVSLQGRNIKKGKTISVKNKTLKIEIFDDADEDDDLISLNFNGKWLVKNHKLRSKSLLKTIHINPNSPFNFITTFAHNLGKMPPNTTAILIDDGKKKQKVVLKSDLDSSDILYLEYEKE